MSQALEHVAHERSGRSEEVQSHEQPAIDFS